MIQRVSVFQASPRVGTALVLCALGLLLSGCAEMGEGVSTAFADPAQFELYDCKQLEATRKSLTSRAAELQGLIAKAQTGFAGPVVGELAYRNDYISVRGQQHFADEAWRTNKCKETPAAATPAAAQPAPAKTAAHAKHQPPMTAGSTVN
ncbi:hypothetical protein [Bradyrhizobium sp.]|uniref:hypothetical protein n=1 Tax=Bradyrhizobium sp. TaxID=376 RepID=UPI003C3FB99F